MGRDPAIPISPSFRYRWEAILIVAVGVGAALVMILVDYLIGA